MCVVLRGKIKSASLVFGTHAQRLCSETSVRDFKSNLRKILRVVGGGKPGTLHPHVHAPDQICEDARVARFRQHGDIGKTGKELAGRQ